MPSEMEKFREDLLESVQQMGRGEAARASRIEVPTAAEARARVGLSQKDFALLLGVSPRTLQDWEQGRREPTGAAKSCFALLCPILKSCANCTLRNSVDQTQSFMVMPKAVFDDPVVSEIHAVRKQLLADCDGDIERLMETVAKRQDESEHELITKPFRRRNNEPLSQRAVRA